MRWFVSAAGFGLKLSQSSSPPPPRPRAGLAKALRTAAGFAMAVPRAWAVARRRHAFGAGLAWLVADVLPVVMLAWPASLNTANGSHQVAGLLVQAAGGGGASSTSAAFCCVAWIHLRDGSCTWARRALLVSWRRWISIIW